MRFVLGIDESGYGPRVGPLAVASCLLRVPDEIPAVGPGLWEALTDQVIKPEEPLARYKDDESSPPQLFIGDSKLIHVEKWPHELERAALGLVGWCEGEPVRSLDEVLGVMVDPIDSHPPWLAADYGRFPLSRDVSLPPTTLASDRIELVALSARVLSARQFNDACERTQNKAIVNWALVALLLEAARDCALELDDDTPLDVVVDRQGGRAHYEPLLEELFGEGVTLVEKTSGRSAYSAPHAGIRSIEFLVGGDIHCFAVSVASIIAKYLREVFMARLNDYFCQHMPELAPTEGYYSDGKRFVRETAELRARLGISDHMFVRNR